MYGNVSCVITPLGGVVENHRNYRRTRRGWDEDLTFGHAGDQRGISRQQCYSLHGNNVSWHDAGNLP